MGTEPAATGTLDPPVATARLRVTGMTCAGCVQRVETAIGAVAGVQSASVNLVVGLADVGFAAAQTSPQQVADAVTAAGFPATVDDPATQAVAAESDVRQVADLRRQKRAIAFALAAGLLTMVGSLPLMQMGMTHAMDPVSAALMGLDRPARAALPWLFALDQAVLRWILLAVCSSVVLGPARGFFVRAWHAAQRRSTDMNTLVALGTATAWMVSIIATVAPQWVSGHDMPMQVWYDAVPWVPAFVLLGRLLEDGAKLRARAGLDALVALQPALAQVLRDGVVTALPLAQVRVGDLVQVQAGAAIAVDGVVTDGASGVDESHMTGEALPVRRGPGDRVLAGTVACDGRLVVRATAIGQDAALAHIARQIEGALLAKPALQKLADRVAAVFTPIVLGSALLAGAVWAVAGPEPVLGHALLVMMSVVIVACPCAMGLAVPMAVWVATGRAAQLGVLVRRGTAWEQAARIDTVVFDKTGTLTEGRPQLVAQHWISAGVAEDWAPIAAVAAASTHPLAKAVAAALAVPGQNPLPMVGVTVAAGLGIGARCAGALWRVGAAQWACQPGQMAEVAAAVGEAVGSIVVASRAGKPVAVFVLRDAIRSTARRAVADVEATGAAVCLASGDREQVVAQVAQELGITRFRGELRPHDKLAWLQQLRADGRRVAMVGDGVNDGPALAAADLAIAIGDGSAVAVDQADVVLLRADLGAVAATMQLAKATDRILRQNLLWAFGYNVLAMPLAAGVLYPVWHTLPSPMIASATMALSSLCVVANALRLKRWQPVAVA